MPKFVNPGDSLEGDKILTFGRKIISGGLPERSASGKLLFPIEVKRGGGARIEKAFTPPVPKIAATSRLAVDDELWGDVLAGFSRKKFSADDVIVGGGRTSSHSGQSWMMDGDCFIKIIKNWLKQAVVSCPAAQPVLQE